MHLTIGTLYFKGFKNSNKQVYLSLSERETCVCVHVGKSGPHPRSENLEGTYYNFTTTKSKDGSAWLVKVSKHKFTVFYYIPVNQAKQQFN